MPKATVSGGIVLGFSLISITTEPSIELSGAHLSRKIRKDDKTAWTIVMNRTDNPEDNPTWARPVLGKDPFLVFSPRGVDIWSEWSRKSPPNYVDRSHALLGRPAD